MILKVMRATGSTDYMDGRLITVSDGPGGVGQKALSHGDTDDDEVEIVIEPSDAWYLMNNEGKTIDKG